MTWIAAFSELELTIASRDALVSEGATGRELTAAVRNRHLLRIRRDHYALPGLPRPIVRAVRIGGRIGCLAALAHVGIFAIDSSASHVHLARDASRLRHPDHRARSLAPSRAGVVAHWGQLLDIDGGNEYSVGIRDALLQVVQCQQPHYAIASLDNALFLGAIDDRDLREIFAAAPDRYRPLLSRVDGRAEAGQESVLRLAIEDAGFQVELQVHLEGVGRVDLLVEGCVVVEADSRLAHDGWEMHVRDRNRDIDAARLGYPTIRPAYQRTMSAPHEVVEAVRQLLRAQVNFRVHL